MHGIYRHLTVMLLRTTHLLPSANRRDGDTVLTQCFERAVFEYHPGNEAPYQVLLRRLGVEELQARGWCAADTPDCGDPDPHHPQYLVTDTVAGRAAVRRLHRSPSSGTPQPFPGEGQDWLGYEP
jgi:hypothetical protein